MERHAVQLGVPSDLQFYWGTGALSTFLDNAPAYSFSSQGDWASMDDAAQMSEFIAQYDHHLVAISLGATCLGALTLIGSGPNLLVKAIAEHAKVRRPSIVGYAFKFALPVLAPISVVVSILFF